jgi:hypothetical protein
MNSLKRLLDALPPPYSVAEDSQLGRLLAVFATELDALSEDIDRVRQTHWVETAYRLSDLEKLGALFDERRFPWESLRTFRARLLALIVARLRGALAPGEIRFFTYDYLTRFEQALGAVLVPDLSPLGRPRITLEGAFEREGAPAGKKRLLRLVENPEKPRVSATLLARGGRVPYLFRWQEVNRGLLPSVATFRIVGFSGGRTAAPVLVNRTTGDLIGYRGTVPHGLTLSVDAAGPDRTATATLDGEDVTDRLFSVQGFRLGVPFEPGDLDPAPLLPRLDRGDNDWIYLSVGLFDVRGLNRFFFAIADEKLREAVFDETEFDHSIFPVGPVARLSLEWNEAEPASFQVRVPRYLVAEPVEYAEAEERPYEQFEQGLRSAIREIHAAGVRADVRFEPFVETQPQSVRMRSSWQFLPPEAGPVGESEELELGGRFGEAPLGKSRFN